MVHSTIRFFEYFEPTSIKEAVSLLQKYGAEAKIVDGGTDLVPQLKTREIEPNYVVDISRIKDLNYINDCREDLRIGAVTTHDALRRSPLIERKAPALTEALRELGNVQIQNLGTIGGNLANASPAADTAPPLMVLGARLKVVGPEGEVVVPVEDFFISVNKTVLEENQLVTEIQIPTSPPSTGSAFAKLGRRAGHDLSIASAAAAVTLDRDICRDVRIALGSVAPTPLRATKTEDFLRGKRLDEGVFDEASEIAADEISPISDVRASAQYRIAVSKVLVQMAVKTAAMRR